MMETLAAMVKKLCKEIKIEFIRAKLDSKEKARQQQTKINNIELWSMRYQKIILWNLVDATTKLDITKPILVYFMTNYDIRSIL